MSACSFVQIQPANSETGSNIQSTTGDSTSQPEDIDVGNPDATGDDQQGEGDDGVTGEEQKQNVVVEDMCNYEYDELKFRLPQFTNVKSDDVQAVNNMIHSAFYENYVEEARDALNNGFDSMCIETGYTCFKGDEYISVLVWAESDWDFTTYTTINMWNDGTVMTNEELLRTFGMGGVEFIDDVRENLELRTNPSQYDLSSIDEEMQVLLQETYGRTMSNDNINIYMPMYVDEEGNLCYVARIYSIAGADYYDHTMKYGERG